MLLVELKRRLQPPQMTATSSKQQPHQRLSQPGYLRLRVRVLRLLRLAVSSQQQH